MIEWNEMHVQIRDAFRRFVEAEVKPKLDQLEHGDLPPYDIIRKMVATFGIADMARARVAAMRDRPPRSSENEEKKERQPSPEAGMEVAMQMIPIIELCRYSPGMVTAMGVSMGLTAAAIMSRGTPRQKERWALPLLTFEKVGAWAITEPGSGSDAFGGMKSTAKRDGEYYVLNGSKTFITNGPYADTIVFICKLDDGSQAKERKVLSFVLDRGMAGLTQSKPLRKMGLHASPTGELFLQDVRVERERLIGETEDSRRAPAPRTPSPWSAPASRPWRSASSSSVCSFRSNMRNRAWRSVVPLASFSSSSSSWPRWKWRA